MSYLQGTPKGRGLEDFTNRLACANEQSFHPRGLFCSAQPFSPNERSCVFSVSFRKLTNRSAVLCFPVTVYTATRWRKLLFSGALGASARPLCGSLWQAVSLPAPRFALIGTSGPSWLTPVFAAVGRTKILEWQACGSTCAKKPSNRCATARFRLCLATRSIPRSSSASSLHPPES